MKLPQLLCLLPFAALITAATWSVPSVADNADVLAPDRVRMLPVILVASDQKSPTAAYGEAWVKNLEWTQRFFAERLKGDTFELASTKPEVVRLRRPLTYYRGLKKGTQAPEWAGELLEHFDVNRFNCPYTFCCLVMNPQDRWPIGGGRPLNGGVNRGGGVLVMSSFALEKIPNFQSTVRHEIAHTVGLPHVDVYGYDMQTNHSVMAYNETHRTSGFRESKNPAVLIPEDLRCIALADSVFPKTRFDVQQNVPAGYSLCPKVITLPAIDIPGHPAYGPIFSTSSGEASGSKVRNLNSKWIKPSAGPGVTFDSQTMWASNQQPDGRIVLNIQFPAAVTLSRIHVHSEHSGKYNRAEGVVVETVDTGAAKQVAQSELKQADDQVDFAEATAAKWRLTFQAGSSGKICLRGLQFFSQDQPLFPPTVPYDWQAAAAR